LGRLHDYPRPLADTANDLPHPLGVRPFVANLSAVLQLQRLRPKHPPGSLALGRFQQHGLLPLLRQSVYSRLAGYEDVNDEDVNDAERLCIDPAMRHVVGGRASQPEKQAASTSEVGRFETENLCANEPIDAREAAGHTSSEVDSRATAKKRLGNHRELDTGGAQC